MGNDNTNNENSDRNNSPILDVGSIDMSENNQSDKPAVTGIKCNSGQFKKGEDPRRNLEGRPVGSVSPITRLKQKFQDNPEEFDDFVNRYWKNPANEKHIVEMIDGSPIKKIAGDEKNPLRIITLDKELAELYDISTSESKENSIEPETI